jgi:GH24 family phage-related lysozyme (muramidase)
MRDLVAMLGLGAAAAMDCTFNATKSNVSILVVNECGANAKIRTCAVQHCTGYAGHDEFQDCSSRVTAEKNVTVTLDADRTYIVIDCPNWWGPSMDNYWTVEPSKDGWPASFTIPPPKKPLSAGCDASSLVEEHEGSKKCAYTDSRGYKTIGVGFNLDAAGAKAICDGLGIDYSSIYSGASCLTSAQVSSLLEVTLRSASADAAADVSSFNSLCCDVQNVVTDMSFNLGKAGLAEFQHTIAAINQQQWADAAAGMRDSSWCGQVGKRCTDDAATMAQGC